MNRDLATRKAFEALARGDYPQAARMARNILLEAPNDRAALTVSGRLALVAKEPEVARALFDRVLAQPPQTSTTWLDQAQVLMELRDHAAALLAIQRALELDRVSVAARLREGAIHLALGDPERSQAAFRRALELDPRSVAAYRGLCQVGAVNAGSPDALAMENLLQNAGLGVRTQADLHYALAQVYRRSGDDGRFIHHLFAANDKQRATAPKGARARYEENFNRLQAAFSAKAFERCARAQVQHPTPIFIVGMPRSGTTLMEQIIAAHPDVVSGGELDYVRGPVRQAMEAKTGQTFPIGFDRLTEAAMNEIAQAYARRAQVIARGRPFIADKTPGNYHVLGLLPMLFPDCKIIHIERDAMDTCFSILQQPFDDRSPHTFDIDLLAFSYAHYKSQMQTWQNLFPGRFLTVNYEALVQAPTQIGRQVYEYCGLTWQDEYLQFNRDPAAVHTFSAVEVRAPISTGRIDAWKRHEKALAPLRAALSKELGKPV